MSSDSEHNYRVFISYAHADAQTEAGKNLIASFKEQINKALHAVAGKDLVFLDSEALNWGDEWSTRIMECLQQCKVFVCLLSPNYQKSSYCKRERLMWERKEIRLGRLRKGTLPVYYIRLVDRANEELRVLQADDAKPFFENLDEIKETIVSEKIERVRRISEQIKDKELTEEDAYSDSIGFLRISPFFVGRLGELAELCEFCNQRHLPIVTGGAGVGKTELVVAYASGYAERYPQGRFLLRMEGVKDWNHAVMKLVEDNWYAQNSIKDVLLLPEDFEKLPLENKRKLVLQRLWKRSEKGRLLLILDNLEQLSLVSDNGLNKLCDGVGNIPDNVDIIATSRNSDFGRAEHIKALSHKAPEYRGLPIVYEIDNLDTASVFELFCHISNNHFPFARCNPEQLKDDVSKEYEALKEMIVLLKGHVWSLEIIAAFMAEKMHGNVTFQSKLEELKKDTSEISGEGDLSYRHLALSPEKLLQPTFNYIKDLDYGCSIGQKIMELAIVASFFTPDMVSDEALLGYWKMYYTDIQTKEFDAGEFALRQLHDLHILNGEGSVSKMHRLTRDVLLKSQADDKKIAIIKRMQEYWNGYQNNHYNIMVQQVQPWTGWAIDWLKRLPALRQDEDFLMCVGDISNQSQSNNLYEDAEKCYSLVLENARKMGNQPLFAAGLMGLANIHSSLNLSEEAEREFDDALETYRKLAGESSDCYKSNVADALNNIAFFHANFNRNEKANLEYKEALDIYHCLAESNPGQYDSCIADTLNNLANFHDDLNFNEDAEQEYHDALLIYRRLASSKPEYYNSGLAMTLNNLSNFHKKHNHPKESEVEFKESLNIYRNLAQSNPERYESYLATLLNNFALFHEEHNRPKESIAEYEEALDIYRRLAKASPTPYDFHVALLLCNLANLHTEFKCQDKAIDEYKNALAIYRRLVKTSPCQYEANLALTLDNLANLHYEKDFLDDANREYDEALTIRRRLAKITPERYNSDVAKTLNGLALLHRRLKQNDKAEQELGEALTIRRQLVKSSPNCYDSDLADTLNNLALLHEELDRLDEAEREYTDSLAICRRLAASNHERFDFNLADTLRNLATLHAKRDYAKKAEKEFNESLKIFRGLAEVCPECYKYDVADALSRLAELHACLGQYRKAECEFNEVLSIYHNLEKTHPGEFNQDVKNTEEVLERIHEAMKHSANRSLVNYLFKKIINLINKDE